MSADKGSETPAGGDDDRDPAPPLMRGVGVLPLAGDPLAAVDEITQREWLTDHDPATVLEAASGLLQHAERREFGALADRLTDTDRARLAPWVAQRAAEGAAVPLPVHPLAILAATTVALAHSTPGGTASRDDIATVLVRVAAQYNAAVVDTDVEDQRLLVAAMARSGLWRAVETMEWVVLAADLLHTVDTMEDPHGIAGRYHAVTGLSVKEWWYRTMGETMTRLVRGAGSYGGTKQVDADLNAAWAAVAFTTVEAAVASAQEAVAGHPHSVVKNPFDLRWLASRPIIFDGQRRWSMWSGSLIRALLPSSIAQHVADTVGVNFDLVAAHLGDATQRFLEGQIETLPVPNDEVHHPEAAMPARISKCDRVIEHPHGLVGIEYTIITPTRKLTEGSPAALDEFVDKAADKFRQAYSAFDYLDPERTKHRFPLLVLGSPAVVDPMVNEWIHKALVASGDVPPDQEVSEVMSCYAPDFLDLIEYCRITGTSLLRAIVDWRYGPLLGTQLDWWLHEKGDFHRSATKARLRTSLADADAILNRRT